MDKTIQLVVVAMVAISAALIILFLMQGQTDSFSGFLDSEQSNAKCELWVSTGQCGKVKSDVCTNQQVTNCETASEGS
ncbi:hypothetical protein GLU60_01065 [Nanohaloarchaea archaeon H01]|nr:hypothetical protein [Nanohaloarchaea archaeon H01]